MKDLRKLGVKKVELNTIKDYLNISEYLELHKNIYLLIDNNIIQPIKASGANGMKPALYKEEKFLSEGKGEKILKNLGFNLSFLNIYETTEPIAYYSLNKNVPQNMLIIENKDTFYSIRKYLMEDDSNQILGENISTLIYGSGKKIYKSFKDFKLCAELYFFDKNNKMLYFGDLDYEGIIIYEGIYEIFKDNIEIQIFKDA